jgi:hypothetical protein
MTRGSQSQHPNASPDDAHYRSDNHAGRAAQRDAVGVGQLREVSAACAARMRRAGDPLGRPHVERQAAEMRPLHRVWPAAGLLVPVHVVNYEMQNG